MSNTNSTYYFLSGGGEMGELMRAKDWSKTPLGDPADWPPSLCTMVAVMLNNPFGMYIAWGSEYTQLYNDGYRPILGTTKHPQALGSSTRETFSEIWHIIESMFDGVMQGRPVGFPDFMLPLHRNGFEETCYFDFSYSPIKKENGEVGGVLVTVIETTEKKRISDALKESNSRYIDNIMQAPVAMCIIRSEQYVVEIVNEKMLSLWGKQAEEVIKKPIFDGLPEVKDKGLELLLENVYKTGEKFVVNEKHVKLHRQGKVENTYVNFVYNALKEADGTVFGIVVIAIEVTAQVIARRKIEEADKRFRNTVKQAPVGITILRGSQYIVEMANDSYLQLVDRKENEFVGRPLFEVMPEVEESVHTLLDGVLTSGVPYHGNEVPVPINRFGKREIYYFDFLYYPLKEENGNISGVIVTVTEVSEKVEARMKTEQNEERLNIVVEASELGTWELNLKTMTPKYSKRYLEIVGGYKDEVSFTHEQVLHHLHPDDREIREKAFREAMITGYLRYEARLIWNDNSIHWIEVKGKVFYDAEKLPEKMIATLRDITADKKHRQALEESEQRFRNLIMQSPVAKAILQGEDHIVEIANDVLLKDIWRKSSHEVIGKKVLDIFPELKKQKYSWLLNEVYSTGLKYTAKESLISLEGNAGLKHYYIDFEYAPVFTCDNKVSGIKITAVDVTEKVEARKQIEASEKRFRSLAESLPQLVWETDEKGNPLFASGRWEEYSGITPVSEAAWKAIIHPEDFEENARLWKHSLATGEVYRCDVRLKSKSGQYRWHAVIGEPVYDTDNNIIKWVGAFTDNQNEKSFTQELEKQVAERTKELEDTNMELAKMNKELQTFAYISSHDLQEPLRKIQTFATQILHKESQNLSETGKDQFRRMVNSAARMQKLIDDLLIFSRTTTSERKFEKSDLNEIVKEVKDDLREELFKKHALVETEVLGTANIIPVQFRQLLINLLNNSLKFSNPDVPPHIKIKIEVAAGKTFNHPNLIGEALYCHISLADNGIGFEQQYSERIFEVFQRLHGRNEYEGTGIGLSIVKRIVENHNGFITATGELHKGARFDIYIPAGAS